jgi:hypothetical protein
MKSGFRVMLIAMCSALLVVAVQAQIAPPPPPPPARDYPIAEWKTFTSETWKFSALMPTVPTETTGVVKNTKQHFFKSFMSQHTFQINCYESDSETASLETAATNLRNTFLRGEGAKLLRDEKINLGSYDGRELAIAITRSYTFSATDKPVISKSMVQTKVFAVGRRVYLLIATSLNQEVETKEAQAFLNSFKLLDTAEVEKSSQSNSNNR